MITKFVIRNRDSTITYYKLVENSENSENSIGPSWYGWFYDSWFFQNFLNLFQNNNK
jgi:hypothetical protein